MRREIRVVLVLVPLGGIGQDVFADRRQFGVIPNDVFIIPALPDGRAWGTTQNIDSDRGGGFEQSNDGGDGIRRGLGESFRLRRGTLQRAPTLFVDHNDAVEMVWRDGEGVEFSGGCYGTPCLLRREIRVVLVLVPLGGIGLDVLADRRQFGVIPNDVFVIPALPDGRARGTPQNIDAGRGGGFEQSNDGGNGIRRGLGKSFHLRRGTLQPTMLFR